MWSFWLRSAVFVLSDFLFEQSFLIVRNPVQPGSERGEMEGGEGGGGEERG